MDGGVNIDPVLLERLRTLAQERGTTLSQVVDEALRRGIDHVVGAPTCTVDARGLGLRPGVNLRKATALAAALEDESLRDGRRSV